jgi:asparagine synthase (glutamine-hydrolysing)
VCGICGIAGRDTGAPPVDAATVQWMTDVIVHRGPDEDGHLVEAGIALGMRRLSIIDLAGSSQPVANEARTVSTVFNGEIYNFPELREQLAARGHTLSTEGDTETIVHLYEEHGSDFPRRLRGMFGIALWDAPRRRLVLTRDRMGVKPLYYSLSDRGLAFASEVKSLIAGGLVEPELDPLAAELFMAYGYVPGPRTLFAGVRKLMPATTLVWEDGRIASEEAYWTPWDDPPTGVGRDWQEDHERLLELLRRSVEARMISDVPLGVMLSGGLDSSLITAIMAEAQRGPVKTYAIGFAEDTAANELGDARRVADRLGTDHHELETSAVDHPELLQEALYHLEEPVADLSSLGFLLLSRLARESVTVALSGQGADELLGGYRKHQVAWGAGIVGRLPAPIRTAVAVAGRAAPPASTAARGLAAATATTAAGRQLAMSRVLEGDQRAGLLTPAFMRAGAEDAIAAVVEQHVPPRELSVLAETLHLDSRLALVDNMLLYFDKISMAASLEVRVPFLDHDVVSFCTALPDSRRVWRLRRKEILKRASRGLVEDAIIDKKKRGFFHSALGAWLQVHGSGLFADVLLDERTRERGQFQEPALRTLLAGAGEEGKKASQRLFCALLLEQWQRMWVDPDGAGRRLARREAAVGARA